MILFFAWYILYSMLAVIKTGGKQYIVSPGQKLKIEKIENKPVSAKAASNEEAKELVFDQVLLLEKDGKLEIGAPLVAGAKVTAKILSQGKNKKVIVYKYKAKKRYHRKKGHRQPFTEIEITGIS